ncbi:hypothetical protein NIES2109_17830 [Nostoc sp. HK-01]|nr:hypothetical protein NIES2109_17830 [Nostoc sp. HK-01]
MPLYLITSLFDEGINPSNFRVVEADSKLDIASHILSYPHQWERFLRSSFPRDWRHLESNVGSLWDCVQAQSMTSERLLELIDMTRVDGDSGTQLAIHEITVQFLSDINTKFY